ncbi:hypothetical protein D806_004920 [Mycolicibacterium smegmatis MKD8]|uniref:Uncharacterized protein n=1 Tax=Mycolicibacterium smegmatis (strain MKD8) TaxID=1214915 RepID=A0A2U9PIH5_MYCSE|nr:hypothetical protein D806_004920 [Mycolicibacterium smegmatis MKD8]
MRVGDDGVDQNLVDVNANGEFLDTADNILGATDDARIGRRPRTFVARQQSIEFWCCAESMLLVPG